MPISRPHSPQSPTPNPCARSRPRATSTTASRRSCSRSPAPTPTASPKRRRAASPSTWGSRSRGCRRGWRSDSSTCPATSASSRTCWRASVRSTWRCSWSRRQRAGCRRPRSTSASSSCSAWSTAWWSSPRPTSSTTRRSNWPSSISPSTSKGPRSELAPVVVCDSLSGRGIDEVRATLDSVARRYPGGPRGRPAPPLDRPGIRGQGRGHRGHRHARPEVWWPSTTSSKPASADRVRVRGIETAKRHVDTVGPGNRVALNLAGIDHHDLARGDAVVRANQWTRATVVDVRVQLVPGETLARRGRVQVYVGSGEHGAAYRLLDPDGRFARLRFVAPLPVAPGDRFVLRDPGRERTVAGAEVLDVEPSAARESTAAARLALPLGERLVASHRWIAIRDLPRQAGLPDDDVARVRRRARSHRCGRGSRRLASGLDVPRAIADTRPARVRAQHHRDKPTEPGARTLRARGGAARRPGTFARRARRRSGTRRGTRRRARRRAPDFGHRCPRSASAPCRAQRGAILTAVARGNRRAGRDRARARTRRRAPSISTVWCFPPTRWRSRARR